MDAVIPIKPGLPILFASTIALLVTSTISAQSPTPAQTEFFEKKVRPILAQKCFSCHGEAKDQGKLRLNSGASLMQGGQSGPAVVPGDPEKSRLIQAVRQSGDLKMPPKGKLKRQEIEQLTRWIKEGA